jgi:RNA polymerase sigma-70 factor (ECF subfamily)
VVLYQKQANTVNTNSQKIAEFMQLYKPLQHRLSAYCRVVTGNEGKALDLIQDTIATAFESFEKLRDAESFLFFLFGIARNCHLKQQRRKKFFGNQTEIKSANIEIASDSAEMLYDVELMYKCIASLNTEQRDVILMFHIMGFSISEIAENYKITEAAVKNRLMRGREKLRQLLSDKESRMTNRISANNLNPLKK